MSAVMSQSKVRENLADTLNRVFYRKERIVLERRGHKWAAVIPCEDLELLEALENRMDLEKAKKALKEKGIIPWNKIKTEFNV